MSDRTILELGIYTVSDAVRLLREYRVNGQKVRGWVSGYARTQVPPIIANDVGFVEERLAMGFVGLMEVRFISYFANQGVQVASIRQMAEEAKELLNHEHPFATDTIFATDGKRIFAKTAENTGDRRMYDLKSKNWAFYDVIAQSLKEGVEFDRSGTARRWRVNELIAPDVVLDPKIAFGQPSISGYGVPTEALFDAFHAEEETFESVARWFELPVDKVKQAVRFETEYARAA